jgi:hypothetical protein
MPDDAIVHIDESRGFFREDFPWNDRHTYFVGFTESWLQNDDGSSTFSDGAGR